MTELLVAVCFRGKVSPPTQRQRSCVQASVELPKEEKDKTMGRGEKLSSKRPHLRSVGLKSIYRASLALSHILEGLVKRLLMGTKALLNSENFSLSTKASFKSASLDLGVRQREPMAQMPLPSQLSDWKQGPEMGSELDFESSLSLSVCSYRLSLRMPSYITPHTPTPLLCAELSLCRRASITRHKTIFPAPS